MTLRPELIRADTLDLQDHENPSAQAHPIHPQPAPYATGPAAPHQEGAIRHMNEERGAEQNYMADAWGSGRSSHEGSELLDEDLRMSGEDSRIDEASLQQDGDDESQSGEGDSDDMMDDRMSSSPSIDDNGAYTFTSTPQSDGPIVIFSPLSAPNLASRGIAFSDTQNWFGLHSLKVEESSLGQTTSRISSMRSDWDLFEPDGVFVDSAIIAVSTKSQPTGLISSHGTLRSAIDLTLEKGRDLRSTSPNGSNSSWTSTSDDSSNLDDNDDRSASDFQFVDYGWDAHSLHYPEEIDPDFVYALHNFVATVEGQANAAKGDSMVLLDDTNSYWWLVRLVKDSSIGYLPAEHIELPVEREARQNKHRNLELARTHLLDEPGRSKNPLKKAMRRRNARRVEFTSPTYYEASEVEWSDEEQGLEQDATGERRPHDGEEQRIAQNGLDVTDNSRVANGHVVSRRGSESGDLGSPRDASNDLGIESAGLVDDIEGQNDNAIRVSKAGTIRNTDSFFGDEAEPRKISLTPSLLREESNDSSARSSGSTDKAPIGQDALDLAEKSGGAKDDKKKKDKKPGMLSGLFKRKEKKIKVDEAAGGTVVKHEVDPSSPMSPVSEASFSSSSSPTSSLQSGVRRSLSNGKLTKAPPIAAANASPNSPVFKDDVTRTWPPQSPFSAQPGESVKNSLINNDSPTEPEQMAAAQPMTSSHLEISILPEATSPETTPTSDPLATAGGAEPTVSVKPPKSAWNASEAPVAQSTSDMQYTGEISPKSTTPELLRGHHGQKSSIDSSSRTISPTTPIESQTEFGKVRGSNMAGWNETGKSLDDTPGSTDTTLAKESEWNDSALHAYLEERSNQDARDLLLIVNDKTGVVPLPLDHPTMLGFGFHEHQKQLNEMSARLDGLLNGFLARKAARPKQSR